MSHSYRTPIRLRNSLSTSQKTTCLGQVFKTPLSGLKRSLSKKRSPYNDFETPLSSYSTFKTPLSTSRTTSPRKITRTPLSSSSSTTSSSSPSSSSSPLRFTPPPRTTTTTTTTTPTTIIKNHNVKKQESISQLLYLLSKDIDKVGKNLETSKPKVQLALLSNFARRVGNIYDFTLCDFKEQHRLRNQHQLLEAKDTIETMTEKFQELKYSLSSMRQMHEQEMKQNVDSAKRELRETLNEKLRRRIENTVERECATRLRTQRKAFQKEHSSFLMKMKENIRRASEKHKKMESKLRDSMKRENELREEVSRLKAEIAEIKFESRLNRSRSCDNNNNDDDDDDTGEEFKSRKSHDKKKKKNDTGWIPVYVVCKDTGRRELHFKHAESGTIRKNRPVMKTTIPIQSQRLRRDTSGVKKTKKVEIKTHEERSREAKSYVDRRLKTWRKGKNLRKMLSTLHLIIPNVVGTFWEDQVLNGKSSKSTYRRALRLVHPDKVKDHVNLYEKLMAIGIFSMLTEEFDREARV